MESQIVNLHSLFNDFYDRGALKITLLTQQLGARWRARAIARLKNEALCFYYLKKKEFFLNGSDLIMPIAIVYVDGLV